MKLNIKTFAIFDTYTASLPTFSDAQLKRFREALIGIGYRKLANVVSDFSEGLFICLCFLTLHNGTLHSNHVSSAVVWVEQQVAILNHNQKQSGKHSNVSLNNSAGSKATTFNQRPSWANNLIDTNCQQDTQKCSRDVEENECLGLLKGLTLKQANPLMKGYRVYYAFSLNSSI
jgi:hypothetical protein